MRIDGKPAPKSTLSVIVSEKPGEEFFCKKKYLTKYSGTSKSKCHEVTGHVFFCKVQIFFESHYRIKENFT